MGARKAQARISHAFAKYDTSGRLSCSLCGLSLKHENLWSSHLISKGHRVSVQRYEREQQAAQAGGKRKRDGEEGGAGAKRVKEVEEDEEDEEDEGGLPADFFSDPSSAPKPASPSPEPEVAPTADDEPLASTSAPPPPTADDEPEFDAEWAAFEATLNVPPPPTAASSTAAATIFAAPVLYEFGAPKVAEEGEEEEEPEEEEGETEEEKRERLDREEREEIMERITEEEREQQEADEKVEVSMKRAAGRQES